MHLNRVYPDFKHFEGRDFAYVMSCYHRTRLQHIKLCLGFLFFKYFAMVKVESLSENTYRNYSKQLSFFFFAQFF